MKLEPIDTSTTAGKARVMQLSAEGRKVAQCYRGEIQYADISEPRWDWVLMDYAIIAQQVGPDEVWCVVFEDGSVIGYAAETDAINAARGRTRRDVVRYRRVEE